jgi:hypothetical protein
VSRKTPISVAVDISKLVGATGAYRVHTAKKNFLKTHKRNGRSATYGSGLLWTGLTEGTHVIHSVATASQPTAAKWVYTLYGQSPLRFGFVSLEMLARSIG